MHSHAITPDYFHGQISIETLDAGLKPWRLNVAEKTLYATPGEALLGRAECSAGVRIHATTDGASIGIAVAPHDGDRLFDLVVANDLISTVRLEAGGTDVVFDIPAGTSGTLEIWLPQGSPTTVTGLFTVDGASLAPAADSRLKWLTYGSSITQCGAAHSPSRTWPATAARELDLALTCMGFGGNCHIETQVARVIRDQQPDIITLKLGINVQGGATLSPRTFEIQAIGLVKLIREAHPETPIGVISPIVSPPRETNKNAVGLSLTDMRELLADAVARLQAAGDNRIRYYDGIAQFDPAKVDDLMPDELHPNGDGYEYMGRNIAANVVADLKSML